MGSSVGSPQFPPRSQCEAVLAEMKSALWKAGPEYVATALLRLQAHYWRPDFTPAQAKELYADFIEDLSDLPPDILDEAIRQYRRDPERKFFPRPGEILGLAEPILTERRRAAYRLEKYINARDEARSVPKRTPEELARIEALVKSIAHSTDHAGVREGEG